MVQWSQSTAVVTHSCPVGYFCQLIIIVFFVFWGTCPLFYLLVHRIETEMPPHKHQIQKHFPFFFPVLAPFLTWRCTPANPDAHLCSSSSQLRVALFWVPSHLAEKRKKKKKGLRVCTMHLDLTAPPFLTGNTWQSKAFILQPLSIWVIMACQMLSRGAGRGEETATCQTQSSGDSAVTVTGHPGLFPPPPLPIGSHFNVVSTLTCTNYN